MAELEQAHAMGARFRCLAITGGEPLLHPEQVNAFLRHAGQLYPDAHTRLYTCGDLLDERSLQELAESGLDEIRSASSRPTRATARTACTSSWSRRWARSRPWWWRCP
ncbi:MAG TPA: hypothetical protein OIL86_09050 [Eggerthellaceae bacterium]|nr:hypothetical protein [Eggerthellaceae bacterium]